MPPTDTEYMHGDKALINPAEDKFGRKALAENLAKGLLRIAGPEGYVVAVFGPWGSGKSTLLNFICHFLQGAPEPERPIVVEFNPWWFSGREDLTISFFNQVSVAVNDGTIEAETIRLLIADFAELVSHYPHWSAKVGGALAKWFAGQKKSVSEIKKELGERLRRNGKRVIIVIDDLDRLIPEEILDVFRLVKAVADLPNVIYLLAFERSPVAAAITTILGAKSETYGDSYLEKIVQLPIELPTPGRISMQQMFAQQLAGIITERSASLIDKYYYREIYLDGIDHFLRTPRDIVRFTNTLKLTFPIVEGEVNPVDFIALEALRVFQPSAYEVIRSHPEHFSGATPNEQPDVDKLAKFHQTWMGQLKKTPDDSIGKILTKVFPKFESAFRNVSYQNEEKWRSELRACCLDKLPIYFGLALPSGDISRRELDQLSALSVRPGEFGKALLELGQQKRPDGRTRVHQALDQLSDSDAAIIPDDGIRHAVKDLLDVGDDLMGTEDPAGFWGNITNKDRIVHIALILLNRLSSTQRFGLLKELCEAGKALSTIAEIVFRLGAQHGKYGSTAWLEKERIIAINELSVLEGIAANRIHDAAKTGQIVTTSNFVRVLYGWKDWSDGESLSNWLREYLEDDNHFLLFLAKLIPDGEINLTDNPVADLKQRRYASTVEDFVNIQEQADRIQVLRKRNGLTEKDRIRLDLLVFASNNKQHV